MSSRCGTHAAGSQITETPDRCRKGLHLGIHGKEWLNSEHSHGPNNLVARAWGHAGDSWETEGISELSGAIDDMQILQVSCDRDMSWSQCKKILSRGPDSFFSQLI